MTLSLQTYSFGIEGNDEGRKRGPKMGRWKAETKDDEVKDTKPHCLVNTSSEEDRLEWEQVGSDSSERFIAEHSYNTTDTFDKNLTWAFTQPCSSHVRQIQEIQRGLHDKRGNSGWNYANPMNRYVELCSDDHSRCSTDIEEVLEKYFKVSSCVNVSTIQRNLAARCEMNEPIDIEEIILESIDEAAKASMDEDMETMTIKVETGNESQRPEKKISSLGVHFLQDKKMLLLQTSHSVRKTARERYQHLTNAFRFPGKMVGSNWGLSGSNRKMSRFLNDECWMEASGRRETCVVTQNVSRHFLNAESCQARHNVNDTNASNRDDTYKRER